MTDLHTRDVEFYDRTEDEHITVEIVIDEDEDAADILQKAEDVAENGLKDATVTDADLLAAVGYTTQDARVEDEYDHVDATPGNDYREQDPVTVAEENNDMGSEERTPADILHDNASVYKQKNEDYGSSWKLAGETVAMWADELNIDDVDISDPQQAIIMGLYWERLIKLIRAFNLELNEATPNNEATSESHADASTYAAMHASLFDE